MTKRIGVIGSSNIDLVTTIERMPRAGETLAAVSFAMGHGGKGANQAVAAAKLGTDVVFVTRVGEDAFGADLLNAYREVGIDTRHAPAVAKIATVTHVPAIAVAPRDTTDAGDAFCEVHP